MGSLETLAFTFSDAQRCEAGQWPLTLFYVFDPARKITRIECVMDWDENVILQIHFYHNAERLVVVESSVEY
jgi:hypothetical protein